MTNLKILVLRLAKKIWPKVTAFALLGIISALAATFFKSFIPEELSTLVDSSTITNILTILASSMLAVTTFSLSTMVSAYSAATSNVTPRATTLITEDPATQNALSAFLGSFLFSLVGIIALSMGIYEGSGRFVLFIVTLGIIVFIVVMFIQWIERLTNLGRVSETSRLVEQAATKAITARARKPTFGCNRLEPSVALPRGTNIQASESGYIQYLDTATLSEIADKNDFDVYAMCMPGSYVNKGTCLAVTGTLLDHELQKSVAGCFVVDHLRTFEQDPRFGLCVLTEIASRAASSAINDNGTVVDIIGRLARVLEVYANERKDADPVNLKRVWVPALEAADLFEDAFLPIARDTSRAFEVQARLQKALIHLSALGDDYRQCAARHSALAMRYVEANMFLEEEKRRLREIARQLH